MWQFPKVGGPQRRTPNAIILIRKGTPEKVPLILGKLYVVPSSREVVQPSLISGSARRLHHHAAKSRPLLLMTGATVAIPEILLSDCMSKVL